MHVDARIQSAVGHQQAGRLGEAEKIYREILLLQPKHPVALHLMGILRAQQKRTVESIELLRRATAAAPDNPFFFGALGNALQDAGRLDEAIAAFRRAIELKPDLAAAHNNLGNVLQEAGQREEAIGCYRQVIRLNPGDAVAYCNLADALHDAGKIEEAKEVLRQAIAIDPNNYDAHLNLGNFQRETAKYEEAIECFRQAIRIRPTSAEAHVNLGTAQRDAGLLDEAIASNQKAISLNPNLAEAHANLGTCYRDVGEIREVIAAYRRALELRPGFTHARSGLLLSLNNDESASPEEVYCEHLKWGELYGRPLTPATPVFVNDRSADRRLRIGYVSSDFRRHSVAYFLLPLIQNHSREQVEIYCYANIANPDEITEMFRARCEVWRNIMSVPQRDISKQIREDQIDILVELAGHTAGTTLLVFASKPAPVQVTWLGYPNTTGIAAIDYRVTDALADPPGMTDRFYVEKLVRLPHCAWCYSPITETPPVVERPPSPICFGSFNNLAKINGEIIALWAELLRRVPDSRLLLKSAGAGTPSAQRRILAHFASHGIAEDRVKLHGKISSNVEHLALYNSVDIALDTYPYHGTTTTCEAMWMGVPVVTLAGKTHVSRVGVSLLGNVGLPELIAQSREEYVSIAQTLCGDRPKLAKLRQSMRDRLSGSTLMNGSQFAADMEAAYREMWRSWCAKNPVLR